MMMSEGENSKNMHTIQKDQATNKNSKGWKTLRKG
jgi:hypothetical protein